MYILKAFVQHKIKILFMNYKIIQISIIQLEKQRLFLYLINKKTSTITIENF